MKDCCQAKHRVKVKVEITYRNEEYGRAESSYGSDNFGNQSQQDKKPLNLRPHGVFTGSLVLDTSKNNEVVPTC